MGKQIKKIRPEKNKYMSRFLRTCGRCGNEQLKNRSKYICRYCGWTHGEAMEEDEYKEYNVIITRGGLED